MSGKGIVALATNDGVVMYKKLSARLPDFLREYPVKDGFKVIIRQTDTLSYQKGLLQLYETAIRAGHKPESVGLPSLQEQAAIVFEASLIGKDGDTLSTATAVKVIEEYKDWEIGETAARQRLLAALGHGGEVFDNDELTDIASRGIDVGKPEPQIPDTKVSPVATGEPAVIPLTRPSETTSQGAKPAEEKTDGDAGISSQGEPVSAETSKKKNENIPRSTIRQIERLARLKKREVPEFASVEQALSYLLELQNQPTEKITASA